MLSMQARLFLIGLWGEADDYGLFNWKPVGLKVRLAPLDAIDVAAILAELENASFIVRIEREGRTIGVVRNFRKWQRPKNPSAPMVPVDAEIRQLIALKEDVDPNPSATPTSAIPQDYPTPTVIYPQMEDVGDKKEVRLDETREADALVSLVISKAIPAESPLCADVMATSVCVGWLRSKYDPTLDVVPAVKKAMASQKFKIKRWDSLTAWVRNAHADRMSAEMARPPPEISPNRPHAKPRSVIDALKAIQDAPNTSTKPDGPAFGLPSDGNARPGIDGPRLLART